MISLISVTPENLGLFQEELLAIEKASFASPWSLRAFQEEAVNGVSRLWVLRADGAIAAYVCFWMFLDEIHVLNLAVHPGRRRTGLGRLLLGRMMRAGLDFGVRKIWLEVRPSNGAARSLYEKAGFREAGRRFHYYTDSREDAVVMSRSLEAAGVDAWEGEAGVRVPEIEIYGGEVWR